MRALTDVHPLRSVKQTQHESISGEVFRPRERIKSQRDFQRVMNQQGNNFNGKLMRIKYCSNEGLKDVDCTRIGIKVPKKFVKREFLYWGTEYVPRMASKKQGDRGVRGGSKGERGKKAAPPREDTDRAA